MDNQNFLALAVFALGAVQAIALLIFVTSGGFSPLADNQTRAVIQTSYVPVSLRR